MSDDDGGKRLDSVAVGSVYIIQTNATSLLQLLETYPILERGFKKNYSQYH